MATFDDLAVQSTLFVGFFVRLEHTKQHSGVIENDEIMESNS
jgi:hypothetical protein